MKGFVICCCLAFAWVGFLIYQDFEQDKMLYRFEKRCDTKGGVTLRGKKDGDNWVGCYKAEEIENEE